MAGSSTTATMAARSAWRRRGAVIACVGITVLGTFVGGTRSGAASRPLGGAGSTASSTAPYPIGVFDLYEPSGLAPPGPSALQGYTRSYVQDFTSPLPTNLWFLYSGIPSGDPKGRFDPLHVAVTKSMLKIGTWRDPRFGNGWVSGGAGLHGLTSLYGAYFVRSRESTGGPDTVALLWPTDNQWPPEIDFAEAGESSKAESWFVHYDTPKDQVLGNTTINITHWHTWGVIWTPTSITFVVDGRVWGQVTTVSEIPTIPMELGLQSQSWCGIKGKSCPTRPSVLEVDWVAIYTPTGS